MLAAAALTGLLASSTDAQTRNLGPAIVGAGPASAAVLGGPVTTTTLYVGVAPSWVPSMLAAYMLDEPGASTHVNAQGTASRNLTPSASPPGQDITNKIEGTAATSNVASQGLTVTGDTAFNALVSVVTFGCWMRGVNSGQYKGAIGKVGTTSGFSLSYASGPLATLRVRNGGVDTNVTTSVNASTYYHVVGTYNHPTLTLYKNGAVAASNAAVPGTPGTETGPFFVSDPSNAFLGPGQLDECFVINAELAATSICRICSCGIRGEQCTCSGATYTSSGRNATFCGSCTLPANCSAAAPS